MTPKTGRLWPVFFLACQFWFCSGYSQAAPPVSTRPAIAIVIDDLGKQRVIGNKVIALPGPVACSFLPHARFTPALAELAYAQHKEVLLHLPMQSVDQRPVDEGGLTLEMTEAQFLGQLRANLHRIPHVTGINNHMGSLLTRHPGHMLWLMDELKRTGGLYFVDSRTTRYTVALKVARETGIPSTRRNVFLDNNQSREEIRKELDRLVSLARKHGTALAIGHPYPETLSVLEQWLPLLPQLGVRLIPVAEMIDMQRQEIPTWQAYLSPSPRAAKNLKQ